MIVPQNTSDSEKTVPTSKNSRVRLPLRAILALILVVFIKESTAIYNAFDVSDYPTHILLAEDISKGAIPNFPHRLYHYLTIAVQSVMPGQTFRPAGLLVGMLATALVAVVMATSLYRQMRRRRPWTAVALSLALMWSAPILLFTLHLEHYFGYQYSYTFHSPTTAVMRPLALITFLYVAYAFVPPVATWKQVFMAALVSVLLINAKPNYSIALLPVAGLISAYRLIRRLFLDVKLVGIVLAINAFFIIYQYLTSFDTSSEGGGLLFRPLFILLEFRDLPLGEIVLKQGLSLIFPVVILVLYWRAAQRDSLLMLAWGCFLVGWFYGLTLIELARAADGNFNWSTEITLFILFFASVHFWIRQMGRQFDLSTRRAQIVMGVWTLHLISGVLWYVSHLNHIIY